MEILKVWGKLNCFKELIQKELKKIGEIEFNNNDSEEKFINSNLQCVISYMEYIIESLEYINKPILKEGNVNIKQGKVFIDDFQIQGGDRIECFIDSEWEMIDVFLIQNEYHCEYIKSAMKENKNLTGRIRLTKEELNNR